MAGVCARLTDISFCLGKLWIFSRTPFSNKGASFFSLERFSAPLQNASGKGWYCLGVYALLEKEGNLGKGKSK